MVNGYFLVLRCFYSVILNVIMVIMVIDIGLFVSICSLFLFSNLKMYFVNYYVILLLLLVVVLVFLWVDFFFLFL